MTGGGALDIELRNPLKRKLVNLPFSSLRPGGWSWCRNLESWWSKNYRLGPGWGQWWSHDRCRRNWSSFSLWRHFLFGLWRHFRFGLWRHGSIDNLALHHSSRIVGRDGRAERVGHWIRPEKKMFNSLLQRCPISYDSRSLRLATLLERVNLKNFNLKFQNLFIIYRQSPTFFTYN